MKKLILKKVVYNGQNLEQILNLPLPHFVENYGIVTNNTPQDWRGFGNYSFTDGEKWWTKKNLRILYVMLLSRRGLNGGYPTFIDKPIYYLDCLEEKK